MVKIRREFEGYSLPTESLELLRGVVGKKVLRVTTGLPVATVSEFRKKESLGKHDELFQIPHGRPYFITLETGETLVFNHDQLLNSIVLKVINKSTGDQDFLEYLYNNENCILEFNRAKAIASSVNYRVYEGLKIDKVSILKYPINYKSKPIGFDFINEVGICFSFSNNEDFVVMTGLGRKYKYSGVAVVGWNEIDKSSFTGLERVPVL